jgi:hypothetical protein
VDAVVVHDSASLGLLAQKARQFFRFLRFATWGNGLGRVNPRPEIQPHSKRYPLENPVAVTVAQGGEAATKGRARESRQSNELESSAIRVIRVTIAEYHSPQRRIFNRG